MKKKPTENKIEDDKGDKKEEEREKKDKEEKAKDKKKTDAEQLDEYLKYRYKRKDSEVGCLSWIITISIIMLSLYFISKNKNYIFEKISHQFEQIKNL